MIKSGYNDASKSVLETAENVLGNLKRVTFTAIVNHSFLLAPYIFKAFVGYVICLTVFAETCPQFTLRQSQWLGVI